MGGNTELIKPVLPAGKPRGNTCDVNRRKQLTKSIKLTDLRAAASVVNLMFCSHPVCLSSTKKSRPLDILASS